MEEPGYKVLLERAIESAKRTNNHNKLEIEYKPLEEGFYYLKISADTIDGGRRHIIFSHEPYNELKDWDEKKLADKIIQIAKNAASLIMKPTP